jgi:hypothetical protein
MWTGNPVPFLMQPFFSNYRPFMALPPNKKTASKEAVLKMKL